MNRWYETPIVRAAALLSFPLGRTIITFTFLRKFSQLRSGIASETCGTTIERAVTARRFATLYVPDNLSESTGTVIRGGRRDL